jgi:sigma-B regulation protein RsbU (phosphoserine phosphatase)
LKAPESGLKKAVNPLGAPIARALIADDQPDVLVALRLLLKGAGYHTEAATSPAGVIAAIKRNNFDLVLMDLNYARDTTSGKEGLDLISRIHALDSVLPIVVMTAWGSVDLAVETMRRGVRDFVQKPWDNSSLLRTLRTQIEQGRAKRNLQRRNAESRLRNRKLRLELKEAREIQEGLLPKTMPSLRGFELASAWQPARTVSGDYLTAFKFNADYAALCVADVAGKGLPAALLMANMQAALKSTASQFRRPDDVCSRVNRIMCGNTPENKFITCFYGVLNVRSQTLAFTNAGHNPPFLIRPNGECLRLEEGGRVLGVFSDSNYAQAEVQLRSGDRLVLFTDGFTEASNALGQELGEERLRELLSAHRELNAAELQAVILKSVGEFCGNDFHDDAALMVVAVQ